MVPFSVFTRWLLLGIGSASSYSYGGVGSVSALADPGDVRIERDFVSVYGNGAPINGRHLISDMVPCSRLPHRDRGRRLYTYRLEATSTYGVELVYIHDGLMYSSHLSCYI